VQIIVASAPSKTTLLIGETRVGAEIFNVSPWDPDASLVATGLALLGETGVPFCLLHAITNATSAATPVTMYVFRGIQNSWQKRIRPAKSARK
jgi:hypothetical protein